MTTSPFKNIIVAGATGTIGGPITKALLSSNLFNVSALSRPESEAKLPAGVTPKKASLSSHSDLVKAFQGQDVLVLATHDSAMPLQLGIIEAAYEAGIRRVFPNEWAAHDLVIENTPLVETAAIKEAVVELLNQKVKDAEAAGKEFHWTGINNGTFFDWALYASFIDISLPPNKTATIWDGGDKKTTVTNLSTVGKAVVAALTHAETTSRDQLFNIRSFTTTQNEIIASLEKATGEKWTVSHTTIEQQLKLAGEALEKGDFLNAFYGWVKAVVLGGNVDLDGTEVGNGVFGLEKEDLDVVVAKIVAGEEV